jgi:sortase B
VDGSEGLPGSLFVYSGGDPFGRFNTIIYGHNMADGSMFGSLKSYRELDWLMAHREIRIYTPEATLTYKVFASTSFPDVLINAVYDDTSLDDRIAYLDKVYNDGMAEKAIPGDVEITTADRIITLSTCVDSAPEQRRLVLGLLTAVEPEWYEFD